MTSSDIFQNHTLKSTETKIIELMFSKNSIIFVSVLFKV
jgi:hypothetical protein